ncbi:MAG: DUF2953 domain-containing protein [Gracilibacteraceae bacterium]|jgi:hypothetical protein|nr:DUF2953 domain-containing protein [Gracilibacteraceae bacterium]
MLIIFKVFLYVLLFLLGLAALLLIIPINYRGQVLTAGGLRTQLNLSWAGRLFGINAEIEGQDLDITLQVLGKNTYNVKSKGTGTKKEKPEQKPEKAEKEKKEQRRPSLRELTDKAVINEILGYFKRVLNIAKPKYVHLYGTYGFDDPSLTGMVSGAAAIIKAIIPNARVGLYPDFTREVLDLDFRAEGSMTVGSLAYQTIKTALKKPVRKILFRRKKN